MQIEFLPPIEGSPVAEVNWNPQIRLPKKRYHILYADPPWMYQRNQYQGRSGKDAGGAATHYPTVKTEDMMKWDIESIAEDNSLLYMWATSPLLDHAINLGNAWGFKYVTVAFVWDKIASNPGNYTVSNCEICLVFKRGSIPQPRGKRNVQQLVSAPRGRHSQKPHVIRKNIELMHPTQTKIELFARRKYQGWDVWGNEV